jgi:hypothetical protein
MAKDAGAVRGRGSRRGRGGRGVVRVLTPGGYSLQVILLVFIFFLYFSYVIYRRLPFCVWWQHSPFF